MKRALKWIGFGLLGVLIVVVIVLAWALNSESGARFVLARAQSALDGKLSVERQSGALAGPLVLEGLRWNDPASGVDARIARVSVDTALGALFGRRVQFDDIAIDGVEVALTTLPPTTSEASTFSLEAPIDLVIGKLVVERARIRQDGEPVFVADRLDFAGAWTRAGIVVDRLALRAPDGSVDLDGRLATAGGYSGQGQTTFRWRVDGTEYAGTLRSSSDGKNAQLDLVLAAPVAATLAATLGQSEVLPWTVAIDAPTFDPERLGIGSSLESLAVSLRGSGDRSRGDLAGTVDVDGLRLVLDPARWTLQDDVLAIETLTLSSPAAAGSLEATGEVRHADTPVSARLTVAWRGVELPAERVGQTIHSEGRVDIAGTAEAYSANGALRIGPPGQVADLRLDLTGTPQAIALETLALIQPNGGLEANGTISLQPRIGWQLDAVANRFDPGAFAADWNGALDFTLGTRGTLTDEGPEATLVLDRVGGTLRGRKLGGKGELSVAPGYIVDGTLNLSSGESTLAVSGRGGDATDVSARIVLASLGDWLPDAGGSARADLRVFGHWPALDVEANATARNLAWSGIRTTSLEAVASVANLEQPAGAVTIKAIDVASGDVRFDTLTIEADGNEAAHVLAVDATGSPASIRLDLAGGGSGGKWLGALTVLSIDPIARSVQDVALEKPARLEWDGQRFTVSESCLAGSTTARAARTSNSGDGDTDTDTDTGATASAEAGTNGGARGPLRLCVGGSSGSDGSLAARYRLEHLPLRTIVRLAAPDAALRMRGEIAGEGEITRGADGALVGTARLASSEGSASYGEPGTRPLLSYRDFTLDAQFAPGSTSARVHAALDGNGRLDGNLVVAGAPGADQALSGSIDLVLESLAFVELLTSEVANTKGRAEARYSIGGTLAAPRLDGALTLSGFAVEVPVAGLKLHDGTIHLRAADERRFILEGGIASGSGRLTLAGEGGLGSAEPFKLTVQGEDFLAADIPAARVVVAPDLAIERGEAGILVSGKVLVPKANVDLARLPGGGVASTSPDVVVIDDKREQPGKPVPITAAVTVVLGEDVKLAGFGFDGTVGGQLVVSERPGRATTGTGTLNVGGTYKAYGQDLKIETGRVLFAGTAIDNPGLDIRASRKIEADDVTAGLLVRGTAQVPVLTVYSEPAMEQSDALSYLVTGKPLSSLKSGEGDMLGAAARALGTAGGDLLAKSIGGRLGVDDIGVSDNAALGGAAFTVGKYLSPKLYLSYGVGIFEPGEVITLRYLFHRRWNFEAQNATTGSRAGINYRYER